MLILGCSPLPSEPCREFTGGCGQLQAQFTDLVPELAAYTCAAFPDNAQPAHRIVAGLIMFAVGFASKGVIERLFERSNDAPAPELWLRLSGISKILLGGINWHFQCARPSACMPACCCWCRSAAAGSSPSARPCLQRSPAALLILTGGGLLVVNFSSLPPFSLQGRGCDAAPRGFQAPLCAVLQRHRGVVVLRAAVDAGLRRRGDLRRQWWRRRWGCRWRGEQLCENYAAILRAAASPAGSPGCPW